MHKLTLFSVFTFVLSLSVISYAGGGISGSGGGGQPSARFGEEYSPAAWGHARAHEAISMNLPSRCEDGSVQRVRFSDSEGAAGKKYRVCENGEFVFPKAERKKGACIEGVVDRSASTDAFGRSVEIVKVCKDGRYQEMKVPTAACKERSLMETETVNPSKGSGKSKETMICKNGKWTARR